MSRINQPPRIATDYVFSDELAHLRAIEKAAANRIAELEAALGAWRTWYEKDRSSARAVAPYEQTCDALGRGE